ncbi:MAG TPA: FAD-dependent oxidoreductase [Opitutaceae bacterium]|nr:FAD-dependent oxidoreductase [Opitutaceae bacterium]
MATGRHIVICGGGVIGLSCAYYLAREGHRVTVVERSAEGADSCAHGSAGYVSPSHVVPLAAPGMVALGIKWMLDSRSPFYVKPRFDAGFLRWSRLFWKSCSRENVERGAPVLRDLCLASRALFAEFSREVGNVFEFQERGLLNLCFTQALLDHETHGLARLANQLGIEARVLDAAATARIEPGVRMAIAGSVYFPIDAHVTPRLFMPALLEALKKFGVEFRWSTEIIGWVDGTDRALRAMRTTGGEIGGDMFVAAAGAWSPRLVDELGIRLPVEAGKGYSLTIPESPVQVSVPMILAESRVAVTPMGRALRFGGTMELTGINSTIRPERVEQIKAAARSFFPDFPANAFDGIEPWSGLRPVSPDGLPYIGRFAARPNLIAAAGHAMLGLTLAPITGALVADVVAGRTPSIPLEHLNPDRFG